MKTVITLIIVLILSSCALKKNAGLTTNKSELTIQNITERFDAKKVEYIGVKKYCIGLVRLNKVDKKDCANCYSENDIYIFWNENGKSYVQKFDNFSEFNSVVVSNFQPSEFLKANSTLLQSEKVGRFKIDEDTYSTISHSCFQNYIMNDGVTKFEKEFDNYDLTGENNNLNYKTNSELKIILLDNKLDEIIKKLENENRFERDKKTCYNNVYSS